MNDGLVKNIEILGRTHLVKTNEYPTKIYVGLAEYDILRSLPNGEGYEFVLYKRADEAKATFRGLPVFTVGVKNHLNVC